MDEIVGYAAWMVRKTNAFKILVWKPLGKWTLGRGKPKCVYNIKKHLSEIGLGGMHWIDLVQGTVPVEGSCGHSKVPFASLRAGKCLSTWTICSFSKNLQDMKLASYIKPKTSSFILIAYTYMFIRYWYCNQRIGRKSDRKMFRILCDINCN